MDKNYLNKLSIPYENVQNHMFKKTIVGMTKFSVEKQKYLDELNTVYYLLKHKQEESYKVIENSIEPIELEQVKINFTRKEVKYKHSALNKIVSHLVELIHEITLTVSIDNYYYSLAIIFRQIIEYVSIYYLLSNAHDLVSSVYLNYATVLEYDALKKTEDTEKIPKDLESAYKFSIENFCNVHSVTYEIAEKEYKKPFGFLYNIFENNDNIEKQLSSKSVRRNVFQEYSLKDDDFLEQLISTADQIIHPTGSMTYFIRKDIFNNGDLSHLFYDHSIMWVSFLLKQFDNIITNKSHKDILNYSIKTLDKIKYESIKDLISYEDNYKELFKKYSQIKQINPKEALNLVLFDFNQDNVAWIPFIGTLKFKYENQSDKKKYMRKQLDILYTLNDMYQRNFSIFIMDIYKNNIQFENADYIYWSTTYLLKFINILYSCDNIQLVQKLFRSYVECQALLHELMISSQDINRQFKELSYVQLENTLYRSDIEKNEISSILKKFKSDLNLDDKEFDHVVKKQYTMWTAHKTVKLKVLNNIGEIVENYFKLIDDNNFLKVLYKECTNIVHANLYGNEINNDLIKNELLFNNYLKFLHKMNYFFLDDMNGFARVYKDFDFEVYNNIFKVLIQRKAKNIHEEMIKYKKDNK